MDIGKDYCAACANALTLDWHKCDWCGNPMDKPFSEFQFDFLDGTEYMPINVWYNPDPDVWNHCVSDCTEIE